MYLVKTESSEQVVANLKSIQNGGFVNNSYIFGNEDIHKVVESLKDSSIEQIHTLYNGCSAERTLFSIPNVYVLKRGYFSTTTLNAIIEKGFKYSYNVETQELTEGLYIPKFDVVECLAWGSFNQEADKFISYETLTKLDYTDHIHLHNVENHMCMGRDVETTTVDTKVYFKFYRSNESGRLLMSYYYIDFLDEYNDQEYPEESFLLDMTKFTDDEQLIYDSFLELYNNGKINDVQEVQDEYCNDDEIPF